MSGPREERLLLADTANKLFAELADATAEPVQKIDAVAWKTIEENGITALFVPESEGGFGGGWEDAFVLLHAAGLHTIALPLAETLLARRLLLQARMEVPAGPIAIAFSRDSQLMRQRERWCLRGSAAAVPWGNVVPHIAVVTVSENAGHLAILNATTVRIHSPRLTIAREPLADLRFDTCAVRELGSLAEEPFRHGALMRAALMAGALTATLQLSVQHANERQQFGRPIGKFQAIQHALALLANEVAAVNCAALTACQAADRGPAEFEIASAKLRANRAVGAANAIAHQVHGAIGFTMEHRLHRATQRLWTWRSEYGNDRYWAARLGAIAASCGAEGLWPYLTALSDRNLSDGRAS